MTVKKSIKNDGHFLTTDYATGRGDAVSQAFGHLLSRAGPQIVVKIWARGLARGFWWRVSTILGRRVTTILGRQVASRFRGQDLTKEQRSKFDHH